MLQYDLNGMQESKAHLAITKKDIEEAAKILKKIKVPSDFEFSGLQESCNDISSLCDDVEEVMKWVKELIENFKQMEIDNKKKADELARNKNIEIDLSSSDPGHKVGEEGLPNLKPEKDDYNKHKKPEWAANISYEEMKDYIDVVRQISSVYNIPLAEAEDMLRDAMENGSYITGVDRECFDRVQESGMANIIIGYDREEKQNINNTMDKDDFFQNMLLESGFYGTNQEIGTNEWHMNDREVIRELFNVTTEEELDAIIEEYERNGYYEKDGIELNFWDVNIFIKHHKEAEQYEKMKEYVMNEFGFSEKEAEEFMECVNWGSCTYAVMTDAIMYYYSNNPAKFEEDFGIPYNSNYLLYDMYREVNDVENGGNLFVTNDDGTASVINNIEDVGQEYMTVQDTMYDYLKDKIPGLSVEVIIHDTSVAEQYSELKKLIDKGDFLALGLIFNDTKLEFETREEIMGVGRSHNEYSGCNGGRNLGYYMDRKMFYKL